MISLMRKIQKSQHEGVTSRRDLLAAGIAGAVALAAPAAASIDPSIDPGAGPDARLRAIVQAYGGEFGPVRARSVNHGRL